MTDPPTTPITPEAPAPAAQPAPPPAPPPAPDPEAARKAANAERARAYRARKAAERAEAEAKKAKKKGSPAAAQPAGAGTPAAAAPPSPAPPPTANPFEVSEAIQAVILTGTDGYRILGPGLAAPGFGLDRAKLLGDRWGKLLAPYLPADKVAWLPWIAALGATGTAFYGWAHEVGAWKEEQAKKPPGKPDLKAVQS